MNPLLTNTSSGNVSSASAKWAGAIVMLVLAVGATFAWSSHQASVARDAAAQEKAQLTGQLDATRSQIDATRNQLAEVKEKLNALTAAQQSAAVWNAAQRKAAGRAATARTHAEQQRWAQLQAKLGEQQAKLGDHEQAIQQNGQAIEQTRQALSSARTELQGSIAHTHDQLVALERKGERNYYEFDLTRSKQYQRTGPVGIALRKVDTRHDFADLDLIVEDAHLQKKHVNLFEPVMFYPADAPAPMELVINQVGKNHIHGYVSQPRYSRTQLASAGSATSDGSSSASADGSATAAGGKSQSPLQLRKRQPGQE